MTQEHSPKDAARWSVRICRPAFQDLHMRMPRFAGRATLRRHAIKLGWWKPDEPLVFDLPWRPILAARRNVALERGRVGIDNPSVERKFRIMNIAETPHELINFSIVPFLRSLISMPRDQRRQFCRALMECSDQWRKDAFNMIAIAEDTTLPVAERRRALMTIANELYLNPAEEGRYGMDLVASEARAAAEYPALAGQVKKMDIREAEFADRLRAMMQSKCLTQAQLAERIGCSQPAISQMLNRNCRPQRKTLEKLAEAFCVDVRELWPDLAVADMLDAVAGFQEDGHVMTDAEAAALRDTKQPRSYIKGRPLPSRKRSSIDGE